MGVQGLTPFLQKVCPTVLKKFPNRLEALRGKKIIIDGTLITQRFHYADNLYNHQHVLSWYRLARDLNKNGVSAICVFDGKERNAAKADETKRRKEVRQLTVARGSIEEDRFQRLNSLKGSITQLKSMDVSTRQEVMNLLKMTAFAVEDGSKVLLQEQEIIASDKIEESLPSVPPLIPPPAVSPPAEISDIVEKELPASPSLPITPVDLASQLNLLHLNYKATVAKLVSISADSEARPSDVVASLPPDEERAEILMSKNQYQLTTEEGDLWQNLARSLDIDTTDLSTTPEKGVDYLLDKSFNMTSSFRRRTNFPTSDTYSESKEVLTAMGIRCIDATGAVEAEALASSIVLSGHADYVASEDTDVLVYGAPLIRNITGHTEPLLVISSAEVRAELDLDEPSYVDFALLLGTDFSQRIKNIGPMRAYEFIKKHGSIERVLDSIESEAKYRLKVPREAYISQVEIARLVFGTLPPVPSLASMETIKRNDRRVTKIMERHGFGRFLQEDDTARLPHDASYYASALAGNFFDDDPQDT